MLEKVKNFCRRRQLFAAGDTVLAACSGGPDSLALVDILTKLADEFNIRLAVAHLDHMIRGEASAGDERFVASFCASRNLRYFYRKEDVPAYRRRFALSLEEAARAVRYAFLRETAEALGGALIATGHHRDDQAETVLLHLIRGAGSDGISGIKPRGHGIIRPLLSVSRAEIETYCKEAGLKPRMDSTNLDTDYLRNKIRLVLLPEMLKINPSVKEALARSAELIGGERAFVRKSAEAVFGDVVEDGRALRVHLGKFAPLHRALKREVVRMAVERLNGDARGFGFFHVEEIIRLADSGRTGARIDLPGGAAARRGYGFVEILRSEPRAVCEILPNWQVELKLEGTTVIPQANRRIESRRLTNYTSPQGSNSIVCDLHRLRLPLFVRLRRAGDRFQPSGMRGTKKLKDFLIDAKVAREERDRILLVCDQAGIVWVCGRRQNETSRAGGHTKEFLYLTILEE